MRDIAWVKHKDKYRFKALTPEAKLYFAQLLQMPGTFIESEKAEIFIDGIDEAHIADWRALLSDKGFQCDDTEKQNPERFKEVALAQKNPTIAAPAPKPRPEDLWTW